MLLSVLLLAVLSSTAGLVVPEGHTSRLVGSSNSGDARFAVALKMTLGDGTTSVRCSGALVSSEYVLFTRRCVDAVMDDFGVEDITTVATLLFGRDILLPIFETGVGSIVEHPTLNAAVFKVSEPIPPALLQSGGIAPIRVADPNTPSDVQLLNQLTATTVSWGSATTAGETPRLLQQGALVLQSPTACRARIGGARVVFQSQWLCVSESSPVRYCLHEEAAPVFVDTADGPVLVAMYSRYLDLTATNPTEIVGNPRECTFASEQLVLLISIRNIYSWLNGVADIKPDALLADGPAPLYHGDTQGLEAASGSIIFTAAPESADLNVGAEEIEDGETGAGSFGGEYLVYPGCLSSLCCCPDSTLTITQSGDELAVASTFSCNVQEAKGAVLESSVQIVLNAQNYTLGLSSDFLQAVNPQTLACSFTARRVRSSRAASE